MIPRLPRSGLHEAPLTSHEILGEMGHLLSVVDAHLLVASRVQVNVVEHAHEDPVWKICRRNIPPCFREELFNPSSHDHGCVRWVDESHMCERGYDLQV